MHTVEADEHDSQCNLGHEKIEKTDLQRETQKDPEYKKLSLELREGKNVGQESYLGTILSQKSKKGIQQNFFFQC